MASETRFDPNTVCLKYCYGCCSKYRMSAATVLYCAKSHKYRLSDLINEGKHELARQICDYLLSSKEYKDECKRYVHLLYAELLQESGKSNKDKQLAEKHYLKSIQLNPSDSDLINHYALFLDAKIGNSNKAIIYFKKALDLDPYDTTINRNL